MIDLHPAAQRTIRMGTSVADEVSAITEGDHGPIPPA